LGSTSLFVSWDGIVVLLVLATIWVVLLGWRIVVISVRIVVIIALVLSGSRGDEKNS